MKAIQIISFVLAVVFTANISAAPAPKPPPGPTDVNVVNTPNVTVTNPQTSVTVDNTTPIPVSIQAAPTVDYEFAGPSTAPLMIGGWFEPAQACRDTYGPTSRWSSGSEVVEAIDTGALTEASLAGRVLSIRPNWTAVGSIDQVTGAVLVQPGHCLQLYSVGYFQSNWCHSSSTVNYYAACSIPK